ncbi:MAG: hypothetical protein WAW23_07915 [Candidatus Methanoperedens sp.]
MKRVGKNKCPKCGFGFFVSEPNRYDILEFIRGDFDAINSECVEADFKIFCRDCSSEIDESESIKQGKIVLKNPI